MEFPCRHFTTYFQLSIPSLPVTHCHQITNTAFLCITSAASSAACFSPEDESWAARDFGIIHILSPSHTRKIALYYCPNIAHPYNLHEKITDY